MRCPYCARDLNSSGRCPNEGMHQGVAPRVPAGEGDAAIVGGINFAPAPTAIVAVCTCPFCGGAWKAGSTRGMLECERCGAIALPGAVVEEEKKQG